MQFSPIGSTPPAAAEEPSSQPFVFINEYVVNNIFFPAKNPVAEIIDAVANCLKEAAAAFSSFVFAKHSFSTMPDANIASIALRIWNGLNS